MKIVLASNNRGKLLELQAMFAPLGVELIRQGDLFEGEAPEPYGTFVENALSKARFAAEKTDCPPSRTMLACAWTTLAACPVWIPLTTARSLATKKRRQQCARLAGADAGRGESPRRHGQHSGGRALAQDPEPLIAVGRVQALLTTERRGSNGFGFDPVLLIPELGMTFAEMTPELKHAHSHRGRSSRAMIEMVKERWL